MNACHCRLAAAACLVLILLPGVRAESNYWRDIQGAWTNGNNWSLGHVPAIDESAVFTNTAPYAFPPVPYTSAVGRIVVAGSTNLTFAANAAPVTLHAVSGIGILSEAAAGHVNFNTTRFILAADQSWRNESASVLTNNGTVTNGGFLLTLDGGGAGPVVFGAASVISGAGGLTVNRSGSGTVTLNSVNLYRGDTTVSNGTLKLGVANALPALTNSGNVLLAAPGRLDLNAFSQTIGALNGDGAIDNSRSGAVNTLTVGYNHQAGSFSGSIGNASGIVALTKAGTGVQILSGTNTYAGLTTVSGGMLRLGAPEVIPHGTGKSNLVVTTAGTCLFDLNGFDETINVPTGAGTLTNSAGSATLTFGAGGSTGTSLAVFRDGAGALSLSKTGTGAIALNGAISIRGGITVEDGALILGGANACTGRIDVRAGVLRVNNAAGSATGSGAVELHAGAALQGGGKSLGSLDVNDGALLQPGQPGGACGTLTVSNMTWYGGSAYECEVTNIANSASGSGVDYDLLVVTGTLAAVPAGKPVIIRLTSRGVSLAVQTNRNYSLKIMAFGTPQPLDTADIELDTNGFLASSGTWQVTNVNKALYVFLQNTSETNNRWIGAGSWSNAANWSLGRVPLAGDTVLFDWGSSAACTADSVSNNLGGLVIGDGYANTVTFNKNAVEGGMDLRIAGDLVIQNGHLVFTSDQTAVGGGTPAVKFGAGYTVTVASVSIATNCSLNADGTGFSAGAGPGGSYQLASKGAPSHGGQGGGPDKPNVFTVSLRPAVYGSAAGPTSLGSGYKAPSELDNNPGGGAIKLNVAGTITVLGRLSADAANRFPAKYPGAGGSIWITGGVLEGNGRISACGTIAGAAYGTGGGGRIDLSGTTNNFTGLIQTSLVQGSGLVRGLNGSLLLPLYGSGATLTNFIGTNIAFGSSMTFPEPVVVRGGVVLTLDANRGENTFTFTSLTIQSGGVVRCLGNVPEVNAEAGGSTNNPFGTGITLAAAELTIEAGGSLNSDAQGSAYGPGYYTNGLYPAGSAAGAHGGQGGQGAGSTYGALSNVTALGSGDGATLGGGALRLMVTNRFTVDGTNSCLAGAPGANRAGGSGGSLWIECGTLRGSGLISADGGTAATSGRNAGGGGRIDIRYGAKETPNPVDAGRVTAFGGTSITNKGAAGTVLLSDASSEPGSVTLLAVNNSAATNTSTLLGGSCFGTNAQALVLDQVLVRNTRLEVASNQTLAVTTVFSNGASFLAQAGSTLAFVGTPDASVFGNTESASLVISNAFSKTVSFEAGKTNSVGASLVFHKARLRSMTDGNWWYLKLNPATGTQDVSRVDVKDSHAGAGAAIQVRGAGSSNMGNNVNWRFKNGILILIL